MQLKSNIPTSWKNILENEFQKEYFRHIENTLLNDTKNGITLYPAKENIFHAFEKTSLDDLKVVILGQDPYHGEGQAHGLSFSVQDGVKFPPSLRNIFKELHISPEAGNLDSWAEQGVLLLNAILTVQAGKPASHAKIGWEQFTNSIIQHISDKKTGVIFLLWGAFAGGKEKLIDTSKHFILKTTHPSPFSAYRGFLGSGCFSEVNKILAENGKKEIDWNL